MKNSNMHNFIKVGLIATVFFGFTLTAGATGTWTEAPTGTPPAGNVEAPINVSASAQAKAGALSVGESAMSSTGSTAGLKFEAGGAAAVTGFANWGKSALTKHVDIGVAPTRYTNYGTMLRTTGAAASGWEPQHFASNTDSTETQYFRPTYTASVADSIDSTSFFGRAISALRKTFAGLFNTSPAYARLDEDTVGCTSDAQCNDASAGIYDGYCLVEPSSTGGTGVCHWPSHSGQCGASMDCPSHLTCTDPTSVSNSGRCVTPTGGGTNATNLGADITAVDISTPKIIMGATKSAINTGEANSIVWSVSGADACSVSSVTVDSANSWTTLSPALNSAGAASGTKSWSSFTNAGTSYYTITCNPKGAGFAASKTVTITVGPTYIMNVYGNASVAGYFDITGNLNVGRDITSRGKSVCLADGTNCPVPGAIAPAVFGGGNGTIVLSNDQGGSLELGASNGGANVNTSGVPYIDFHAGVGGAQDFNFRVINNGNKKLAFTNASGTPLTLENNTVAMGGTLSVAGDVTVSGKWLGENHFGADYGTGSAPDPWSGRSADIKANYIAANHIHINNAQAVYAGCSGSDHLVYKDNASGGGCAVLGYLLHD